MLDSIKNLLFRLLRKLLQVPDIFVLMLALPHHQSWNHKYAWNQSSVAPPQFDWRNWKFRRLCGGESSRTSHQSGPDWRKKRTAYWHPKVNDRWRKSIQQYWFGGWWDWYKAVIFCGGSMGGMLSVYRHLHGWVTALTSRRWIRSCRHWRVLGVRELCMNSKQETSKILKSFHEWIWKVFGNLQWLPVVSKHEQSSCHWGFLARQANIKTEHGKPRRDQADKHWGLTCCIVWYFDKWGWTGRPMSLALSRCPWWWKIDRRNVTAFLLYIYI